MTQLFGIQLDTLTTILLVITLVIVGGVVLLAISNAIFFKIGVRNIPGSEQGFGGMQDDSGKEQHHIADLRPNEVYLNHTVAILLNAHAGDTLYLYSKRWPGKRYTMHVRAIIADGGLVGEKPYLLSNV